MNSTGAEENLILYEKLRDHILQNEIAITNETIYMYVAFFALLTLGTTWNNWVFLLSFVVLIVFQSMINDAKWSVVKASIYIKVFFETKRNDIHWELLHEDDYYQAVRARTNKRIDWTIKKVGASFLAVFSLLLLIYKTCNFVFSNLSAIDTVQICISFVLCSVAIYTNMLNLYIYNKKLQDNNHLRGCIDSFYKKCYQNTCSTK